MRKSQLDEIKSLLQTLKSAHVKLNRSMILKNSELLVQCQESAIAVGNSIEDSEGEGTKSVAFLEEYCELLYQLSIVTSDGEWQIIEGKTKDALQRIEKSLQEINVKKEVVFLPYKASMWDSLESVWMAFKEDPNCNCYVVPIPYFDKKPDGTIGEMHDEGADYPDYVPVTSWKEYNMEEKEPDIIFIHNPYDNSNFVTSVHPRFYAGNICKYTDKLVYIPYFVMEEIELNNKDAIEHMKYFCYLPGTIYADKVVVQSENMRQIYINEYIKLANEYGDKVDRKVLEDRFIGLGSPKLDKRNKNGKGNDKLPEEWEKIIKRSDGSRKKIILYNTTVAALLQHNEKMIDKLKNVFGIFKENKEDFVLWWRPHPLLESTFLSMRPQLWEEYEKLLNDFKGEKWGIYDDTPAIHRAIEISNAYYGDPSSVVLMYQMEEKPIMIQNVDMTD